jgi:ribosomal protein S18 acetylase RimI-like enzyme
VVDVTTAATEQVTTLTDLWVRLAQGQRQYGSHLLASENRSVIREVILRRIVADNVLIARNTDSIVGFVTFRIKNPQYEADLVTGLIENLYVKPDHRRDDIGSALLVAAEQRLADAGADTIHIESMAANNGGRAFYTTHGYDTHRITFEKATETDTS